jgi:hypothetical protein
MPVTAGILSIIAGGFSLLGTIFLVLAFTAYYAVDGVPGLEYPISVVGTAIFAPFFLLSIVAIAGGIFALKRKFWGLALAGAICAVLTILAWPLGTAAIVLLALSKHEFSSLPPPPSPPATQENL